MDLLLSQKVNQYVTCHIKLGPVLGCILSYLRYEYFQNPGLINPFLNPSLILYHGRLLKYGQCRFAYGAWKIHV